VLVRMHANEKRRRLIDVRQPWEFASGHIEGSELVPLGSLSSACAGWSRGEPLTLVCRSGRRAEQARSQLREKGFADVLVLPGGVEQWRASGKPLLRAKVTPAAGVSLGGYALGVVVSTALAHFVTPWFLLLTGFLSVRLIRSAVALFRSTTTEREDEGERRSQ
jgi:rhodanese-related sulfurtransferase